MDNNNLSFDHIHIISPDPDAAARWYEDVLGARIASNHEVRGAAQINVRLAGMSLLIRGQRPGETPDSVSPMQQFSDYASHNNWGTDHFGYTYKGDLYAWCEELKTRGATFSVEPYEFNPGTVICYLAAPDGVSIEIVQARNK